MWWERPWKSVWLPGSFLFKILCDCGLSYAECEVAWCGQSHSRPMTINEESSWLEICRVRRSKTKLTNKRQNEELVGQ